MRGSILLLTMVLFGCEQAPPSTPLDQPQQRTILTAPAGVTHFDDFERPDTPPGLITPGPQGQKYELFSNYLLEPDFYGQLEGGNFVMPQPQSSGVRATYAVNSVSGPVRRIGAYLDYEAVSEGPQSYIWALIVSHTQSRFTDWMIHFAGTFVTWKLEIWAPTGKRRTLAEGRFNPAVVGQGVIDLKLDGDTATVTAGKTIKAVSDPELREFRSARYVVIEHFANGPPSHINKFPAWYYQIEGAKALSESAGDDGSG